MEFLGQNHAKDSLLVLQHHIYGLFLLVAIPGIIGNLLPALIMSFDNFTGKRKEKIMAELEEIRAEAKARLEETETV